jgi:hypothetical protein
MKDFPRPECGRNFATLGKRTQWPTPSGDAGCPAFRRSVLAGWRDDLDGMTVGQRL